ncbi:beta-alanine-activating enzyme isoform X2 [Ooceraea biroi]|uniref:beta-alanine-activating enzyme isoform X2 n=1 Tax=Ooceraea biroi TaxID=2015173 RepID=UPI0005BD134B|nr:beta-alanine-activating enzyme isoform X2 [Ooceraea biroi]
MSNIIINRDINCAKKQKVQNDERDCPQRLHDACNWLHLNDSAIEYHDLEEIKIICYNELQAAKETVSKHLQNNIKDYPEFIGIDFDIVEYCVPPLMLGILYSGHAFFNIPADSQTYKQMVASLHVKYIFSKYVTSTQEVMCQFKIHGQSVCLRKLTDVQESTIEHTGYLFAYAIATSGSTGTPKVVKVPHHCILPNIIDLKRILDITRCDKIAQLTNFTFDPSIVEIFLSLCCAATLFMISKPLRNEASRLLEKIFHAHVTVLQITPSLLFHKWSTERLKVTILDKNSHLRVLLLGGEPFPKMKLLLEASHPQNATRLFNIYGITEVSCWSSINEIAKDNDVRECCLGKPLSGTVFQIKDNDNKVITRGEGVLYIGSTTRICIIGDETEGNLSKPVFRDTGDVVSTDERGRIFYKGRRNNIVKRFGNKVNLRKLEEIVVDLNSVQTCVAFWDAELHKLYLCLSTTKSKAEFSRLRNDVTSHLQILPAIYKPDKIIVVEQFDFTTSGKICLASLKRVCRSSEREITDANNLHVDKVFEKLWDQHVKCKDTGFMMSGGTSIAAIQISSATTEAFNVEFPELIGMLLKDGTFDECVNYVRSTLINRVCNDDVNRYTDVSLDDGMILNTKKTVIKPTSLNDCLISSSMKSYCQWYKCRGKTYGALKQEQNTGKIIKNISNIEIIASYNLQKCVDASPTVYRYSEAELYATVGSHSGIICTVSLLETSRSYEVKLPDRIEASVLVLADFHGIVGCYDGHVYCIHLKTGQVIWKFQTQDIVKCTAIMCAQGSKVFVGSYDRHVYCLSIEDGTRIWKTEASKGAICATGCLHSQSTSVLFGTLDGSCLALRQSSGQVTWKHKLQDPIFVAPVVLRSGHALFCSVAGALCCFDIETDCEMWRHVIGGNVFSYPVIQTLGSTDNELVTLASHNKNLYLLEMPEKIVEKNKPRLKSTLRFHSPIFATPWCDDRHIFVTCTDGTFQTFNVEGKLLATKQFPGETFSSPIVHDDLIILGCRDNNLYVLKLS